MMISQPALMCLETTWQRLLRRPVDEDEVVPESRVARAAGFGAAPSRNSGDSAASDIARSMEADSDSRVAPEGGAPNANLGAPLTPDELRARAAALRALALSRGRRFDAARIAFSEAARLDPTLDLTRTPAFWKLERAAHEAAIDAYVATGRDGDAALLRARVRSTYRPKAIRTRRSAVQPL